MIQASQEKECRQIQSCHSHPTRQQIEEFLKASELFPRHCCHLEQPKEREDNLIQNSISNKFYQIHPIMSHQSSPKTSTVEADVFVHV